MSKTHHRTHRVLAAVLAGTIALPGLALAHGDRDWRGDRRADWRAERRDDWGRTEHRHRYGHHGHSRWHRERDRVVVVERPVYVRPYVPAPAPRPVWGNGVSVILQGTW